MQKIVFADKTEFEILEFVESKFNLNSDKEV